VHAVYLALALASAALQQPDAVAAPDDRVLIDAFVADTGDRPLADLTAADFEIREDGEPQTIEAARYVDADARLVAIYLDEYHLSPGAAEAVRDRLMRFVEQELAEGDRLVVMKPLASLLTIALTTDRAGAVRAIAEVAGRKGDYTPSHDYERHYMAGAPGAADRTRAQVTLSALNALAVKLGLASAEARKTLIVVSEGFGSASQRHRVDLPTVDTIVRSANRSNVSIYIIDPREAPPGEEAGGALARLAAETDGLSRAGADGVDECLRRAARDSRGYYLISYRSAGRTDHEFHAVELRVKRRGASVRTRPGYWALSPDDLMRADVIARVNAPRIVRPPDAPLRTSQLIRPWFGVSRGPDGRTRVTFVWEPVPPVPGTRAPLVPARLQFTALDADGTPAYEGTVLPIGAVPPADEGMPTRAVFDVPPGPARIQMSIEDANFEAIDSDVRVIAVRDLEAPVVLGTPEVFRARTARELRELEADPLAAPVASRVFSRTERLVIRVPAYAPSGTPVVTATLLSGRRQAMRQLTVTPSASPGGASRIELPLAGLASGEYFVDVKATDPAGEARETIGLRVTP
jgi:VWFA-related protein